MPLNIKSPEADRLARDLVALTGESITDAVTTALAERLERLNRTTSSRRVILRGIRERMSRLPVLDDRSDDVLAGYDDDGLFA